MASTRNKTSITWVYWTEKEKKNTVLLPKPILYYEFRNIHS